ncbi:MAG: hypothetical protein NVSMB4_03850 [Acidimicrobiales bacterium]
MAAGAAAIAVAAGAVHGFGPDDETMVGHIHIALGHAIPIVAFSLMIVWLGALVARSGHRCTRTQLVASAVAVVALVLWSGQTAIHSLGFYATAHVDLRVATELNKVSPPMLVAALFAASVVLVLAGLGTALGSAARRGLVPAVAAGLIVIGTIGSFFAGPVGDGVLALGLGWAAVRLSRGNAA